MATSELTLETNTEVFKGDRVVADGVERELGDVTTTGTSIVSSADPFGDGSLAGKWLFENNLNAIVGSPLLSGSSAYAIGKYGNALVLNGAQTASNTSASYGFINGRDSSDNYTISCAVKMSTINKRNLIIYDENGATIEFTSTNKLSIGSIALTGSTIETVDTFTTLDVISLVLSASVSELNLYYSVNGGSISTLTASVTGAYATPATFCVGHGSVGMTGWIDQFELFNGAVDAVKAEQLIIQSATKYSADFNTPLASIPTSVYRLDHDNLTIDGTPTATTATVLDSRTGLIASGDTVLLEGVGVVCNPVVETEVSVLEPDGSLNTSTTDLCTGGTPFGTNDDTVNYLIAGAFDNNFNTYSVSTTAFFTSTQFKCGYTLPSEAVVNKYTITSGRMPQDEHRHPRTWTFEASTNTTDGEDGTWYILDTILDEPVWTGFETKTYTFINNTAYTSYRINVTNTTGTPDGNGVVQEMELIEAEDTKTIYQYDLTYPTQTAPTRIALSNNDVVPTVASDTFDGTDTFTKTYNTVTKTARDVEYGFVADDEVEIVQLNLNQNMEP